MRVVDEDEDEGTRRETATSEYTFALCHGTINPNVQLVNDFSF